MQINITRYPAPYTSKCVSDWSNSNYSDYLPWDDFYYTLSVTLELMGTMTKVIRSSSRP